MKKDNNKNILELEECIKTIFGDIDLKKWEQKEHKNDDEAFIYFSFHKSNNKLFYIGHVESEKRFSISDRIFEDSIKSGANRFKTKLLKEYNCCFDDTKIKKHILENVDIYYIKILKPKNDDNNSLAKYKNQLKKLIKEKGLIENSL